MSLNREFAEALSLYASELLNGVGWAQWTSLGTKGSATVNMSLNCFGHLVVKAVETHELEVTSLEEELKEAQKTIKAQAKENERLQGQVTELTTTPEEPVVPEETAEITEQPTRTRRKRKT